MYLPKFLVAVIMSPLMLNLVNASEIIVGFSAAHPEDKDRSIFQPFIDYLEDATGNNVSIKLDTNENIRKHILEGNLDLAILSPLNYISLKSVDNNNIVRLVAKLEKNNRSFYGSNLIVNKKYSGKKLDVRKLIFLYPSAASTSSYLYPLSMLYEKGYDIGKLNKQLEPEGKYKIIERINSGENGIAGISESTLSAAKRSGYITSNIYKISSTPDEIPYDAIIVSRKSKFKRKLEQAIAGLFVEEDSAYLKNMLPIIRDVSGVAYATDKEYDSIRKRFALVHSQQAYKVGLTLVMQPDTTQSKLNNFNKLKSYVFKKYNIYLDPVIYDSGDESVLLKDLEANVIDIGELPPILSGKAIQNGLKPILIPTYNGLSFYKAIIIKRTDDSSLRKPQDLIEQKLAVGSQSSASANVYPLKYLEDNYGIKKDDLVLIDRHSADEIITLVATGESDAGVLATFRLESAQSNGHKYAGDVETIQNIKVKIYNGAVFVNRKISEDKETTESLTKILIDAARSLGGELEPSVVEIGDDEITILKDHYSWANPRDSRRIVLMIIAVFIIVIAGVAFLILYKPPVHLTDIEGQRK